MWIAGGVVAGVLGACMVALFTGGLSELFGGSGQEVFNAGILGFAVLMLTWHNVWMSRHGRELVGRTAGGRRGGGRRIEIARWRSRSWWRSRCCAKVPKSCSFSTASPRRKAARAGEWSAGGFVGLILGSLVCLMTYLGLVTIPARYLFSVTSTLIAFLAAGMAAQAIAFLEQADILTALDQTVWDTSWILSDSSYLGRALHTLIGYVDQPTAMQLIVYAATLDRHRADEAVLRAGGAAAANRVNLSRRRARRRSGSGTARRGKNSPRSASSASRHSTSRRMTPPPEKVSVTTPAGGSRSDEFNSQQIEPRVLVGLIEIAVLAGQHALEAQRSAASPVIRLAAIDFGVGRRHPVEAIERHHEAVLARLPEDVAHPDEGVLHMRRYHLDVVAIESDELEFIEHSRSCAVAPDAVLPLLSKLGTVARRPQAPACAERARTKRRPTAR